MPCVDQIHFKPTRKVVNRLAGALRMAAESLSRDQSYLGQLYRRLRARLPGGAPEAITAAAHKLARIIYTLITGKQEYDESRYAEAEKRNAEKQRQRLIKQARKWGLILVPATAAAPSVS